MTESFILSAFQRMGETPVSIKVMRNKYSGEAAGYCFVHFQTDEEAVNAMHKLNGKVIPNTQPVSQCFLTLTNVYKRVIFYIVSKHIFEAMMCVV